MVEGPLELGRGGDQGDHDPHARVQAAPTQLHGRVEQRPDLHVVQRRPQQPEAHAPDAQHRVLLAPHQGGVEAVLALGVQVPECVLDDQLLHRREELVQGRVQQAHRDRQAVHDLEQVEEVGLLHLVELGQRGVLLLARLGQDGLLHHGQPVAQELVLGAAQADALGPVLAGDPGVGAGVGVGPHLQAAHVVGPLEQALECGRGLGSLHRDGAQDDLTGGPVDRDHVAGHDLDVADVEARAARGR